jgi:hypothetical protein
MKPEQFGYRFNIGLVPGSIVGLICKKPCYGFLKVSFPLPVAGLSQPFLAGVKTRRGFAGVKDPIRIVMQSHRLFFQFGDHKTDGSHQLFLGELAVVFQYGEWVAEFRHNVSPFNIFKIEMSNGSQVVYA